MQGISQADQQSPLPNRAWSSIGWTLIYILIFVGTHLIVGFAIVGTPVSSEVSAAVSVGTLDRSDPVALAQFVEHATREHATASMHWTLLIAHSLGLLFIWPIAKMRKFDVRKFAGLTSAKPSLVAIALLLGVSFSLAFNSLLQLPAFEVLQDYETGAAQALLFGSIFTALIASTIVPFTEEVIFRGFILNELRRGFSVILSVIFTSAAFGLMHGTLAWAVMAGALGLLLAWIALRMRSVWPAISAHIGINATSFIFVWLIPHESDIFNLL
ncbi:MAG: CPBP family intramembrane metalloprotease, partial [Coriobacteriia bacterium]|nr:CPBP family intramembrane metalloprotease [Coriobacteriia bacterium]